MKEDEDIEYMYSRF